MPVRKDKKGRYHVEICYNRHRVHRRCPEGASKAEAYQLEAKIKRDLWLNELGRKPEVMIGYALQDYIKHHVSRKSTDSTIYHCYRLGEWIDGKTISEAPEAAQRFIHDNRRIYKPATINRSLAALRRACNLAYKRGWVNEPVGAKIELLREDNKREVYLTKAEVESLVNVCPDQQGKDAILIAAYTGLRLGELLALKQAHVKDDMIWVVQSKTGKPRSVPIIPAIRKAVARLPITHPRRHIQKLFERARAEVGLDHVHYHDLRHTTASFLVNAGVDLYTVGTILGHASPVTTKRYSHLNEKTIRTAMQKIAW